MTTPLRTGISAVSAGLSIAMAALQIFLAAAPVLAGEIFGSIKADGKSVGKGVKVEIAAPSKLLATESDNYGSYRIYVPEKGKCTLTVHYRDQKVSIPVYSYERSTRYDFSIDRKDSLYVLKRK
ncbi:MAG: hypothetical protein E6K56_09415 [Ignavibacteria bacterium]|nr:MAG: hypothetical protein E6K56_09415 [Ignavibacteria bacterium]